MKKQKKYKSINTILKKVKEGELEFNDRPSLFKKFEFNKRPEIIKPYLHNIDRSALLYSVDNYIMNPVNHNDIVALAKKDSKILDPNQLPEQIRRIWAKFPKETLNDIFNIHYNDIRNLEFEQKSLRNGARYTILEKSNDPVVKVITREDNINSMIYTRSIVQYYLAMLAITQQKDNQEFEKAMNSLKGGGSGSSDEGNSKGDKGDGEAEEGDSKDDTTVGPNPGEGDTEDRELSKILEDMQKRFESSTITKKIEKSIMEKASQSIDAMGEMMSKEEKDLLWKDLASKEERGKISALKNTDPIYLEKMEKELKKINLNMDGVKDKIKNLLDKSISYFSCKEVIYHEDIFEASNLSGLEDYILLHPKIRKVFINDIDIIEKKKLGKIDVYVDVSGSMGMSSGITDINGKSITKSLFAKALVFKMKELDLLNDLYSFESSVKKRKNSQIGILSLDGGGGTNTRAVIESIEKRDNNAIIITDAQDHCELYTDKAFFIGVDGANFSSYSSDYMTNEQICVFDGNKVYKVDSKGNMII